MDSALVAGIAAAVTLIIREVIAGVLQLRYAASSSDKKEREEFEARMRRYLAEAQADRDEARQERAAAEQKAADAYEKQIESEKAAIRLEARIESLTPKK